MGTTKSLIVKSTLLTGIALLFTGLTRIVYTIAVGKNFGADILGQMNLVISFTMLCSLVISTTVENAAAKYLSEFSAKEDIINRDKTFTMLQKWTVAGSAASMLVVVLLCDLIARTLQIDLPILMFGLPLIVLITTHNFYRGCFYGFSNVGRYFKFETISSLLFFVILGVILLHGEGNLLLPFILFYGLFSLLAAISLREHAHPSKTPFLFRKEIGIYGLIAMIGTVSSTAKAHIANLFTGVYLSPEQVGYYSAAVSITTVLLFAPSIIGRVLLPSISHAHGAGNTVIIKTLLNKATDILSVIALFLCGISIILSEEILMLLFTPDFAVASFSLQTLVLGICLSTITVPAVSALSGTKYVKIPNIAGVLGLVVSFILWPFFIPMFGINGTAMGYIIGVFVTAVIPLYYAQRIYGLDLRSIARAVLVVSGLLVTALLFEVLIPFEYGHWVASGAFALLFLAIFKDKIKDLWNSVRMY